MRKKLLELFEYMTMLNAFRRVERVMRVSGTDRMENDQEHSYELAMMAWFLVDSEKMTLNRDLVIKYALVHDLAEVYAGDTYVFSKDPNELASKEHRETEARERLAKEFPMFEALHQLMEAYERREDRESRFVYALDKIHPIVDIYLDEHGFMYRREKVTWKMLMDHKKQKVALSPEAKPYFDELMLLLSEEEGVLHNEETV
jgi:putative hydrolase of HD superfamily